MADVGHQSDIVWGYFSRGVSFKTLVRRNTQVSEITESRLKLLLKVIFLWSYYWTPNQYNSRRRWTKYQNWTFVFSFRIRPSFFNDGFRSFCINHCFYQQSLLTVPLSILASSCEVYFTDRNECLVCHLNQLEKEIWSDGVIPSKMPSCSVPRSTYSRRRWEFGDWNRGQWRNQPYWNSAYEDSFWFVSRETESISITNEKQPHEQVFDDVLSSTHQLHSHFMLSVRHYTPLMHGTITYLSQIRLQ